VSKAIRALFALPVGLHKLGVVAMLKSQQVLVPWLETLPSSRALRQACRRTACSLVVECTSAVAVQDLLTVVMSP